MRDRNARLAFTPFILAPFFVVTISGTAAASDVDCVVAEVTEIVDPGPPAPGEDDIDGVRVTLEGAVPADVGRVVTDVVTDLMAQTEPIRTTVTPVADGVVVSVRGVSDDLPVELPAEVGRVTGCLEHGDEAAATDEEPPESEPTGPEHVAPRAQEPTSCSITSVLPVDASGEATAVAGEVEGALIGVAGPLPVGVESTVADVFVQAGAAGSDAAVEVVNTVGGAQIEVQSVTGPLPADLSSELATALNCTDSTGSDGPDAEPSPDGTEPTTDPDVDGSTPDATSNPETGESATLGQGGAGGMTTLPRTGGTSAPGFIGAGVLGSLAFIVRRLLGR